MKKILTVLLSLGLISCTPLPQNPFLTEIDLRPHIFKTISPPTAPSNLTADTVTDTSVLLRWVDNATDEEFFTLYGSIDNVNFYPFVILQPDTTSYENDNLPSSSTFYYKIRAENSAGASAFSNTLTASTTGGGPSPTNPTAYQWGYDLYGLAKMDINMVIQTIEPGHYIGVLDNTFGNSVDPLTKIFNAKKAAGFRVHLGNGSCQRNGNCARNELSATDIAGLKKAAAPYEAMIKKYGIKGYCSPRVEHDEKSQTLVNSWYAALRQVAPDCIPVCSAISGYCPPNVLREQHGFDAKGDIISGDGSPIHDSQPRWAYGGKVLSFAWMNTCNGRGPNDQGFVQPLLRPAAAFTSATDIQYMTLFMHTPETQPQSSCPVIQAPALLKPYAEYSAIGNDPRAKKPAFLIAGFHGGWNITSTKGASIGRACEYAGLNAGRSRFYTGNCSGDSSVSLYNDAKSEWSVWRNGNKCFLINHLRRQGQPRADNEN